ncbi:MAG: hypothetical protein E6I51_12075 [Chloroflexi bacterium]|nr:MAG: hypothetical protein E6I51_12075 [Chloroflexota bacterium]
MTFLARRDPTVKLAVVLGISLLLILIVDPVTPALFLAVALAVALAGGARPCERGGPALRPRDRGPRDRHRDVLAGVRVDD